MNNTTQGRVVVLSNDGFEVFEMVSASGFAIPCPVVPRPVVKLPRQPDESEFAAYVMKGGAR